MAHPSRSVQALGPRQWQLLGTVGSGYSTKGLSVEADPTLRAEKKTGCLAQGCPVTHPIRGHEQKFLRNQTIKEPDA